MDRGGLSYVFYDNKWETRARSSGGYDAIYAIGYHHDASSPSSSDKANEDYCWVNADSRPIGAVRIRRNGVIAIGAAGATNTMGKGGPLSTSAGYVPQDKGNQYMFAIEAANNGAGEPWPKVQLDAYFDLCAVLCEELDLEAADCFSHWEYCRPSCDGRKIDPAGPTPDYPDLGGSSGVRTWSTPAFRNLVAMTMGQVPPPQPVPEPEDDDVIYLARLDDGAMLAVGSAVRPVSQEELSSGALGKLTTYNVPAGSYWDQWMKAGAAEYGKRVGMS